MEKEALRPLPLQRYELRDYKMATVQKNSQVYYSNDKNNYSVPYTHIGKKVKMILTQNTVEIYHNQTRIALHARSRKAFHYTTVKEHMPMNHTYTSGWRLKVGNERLNNACKRALKHEAVGYIPIKNILERGLDTEEEPNYYIP